ncbi:MAG TPA: hypothetical protein VLR49_12115, partial [Ferruginibacter sp.]|nr:hypothetical protein [Ferruginibacter sp.]
MKKIFPLLLLVLFCSVAEAQLLKKIKEKANKALETKKPETSPGNGTNESSSASGTDNNNSSNAKTPPAPPANGTVVFSLGTDETLLYDESKIITKNNKVSYSFVVQNKK